MICDPAMRNGLGSRGGSSSPGLSLPGRGAAPAPPSHPPAAPSVGGGLGGKPQPHCWHGRQGAAGLRPQSLVRPGSPLARPWGAASPWPGLPCTGPCPGEGTRCPSGAGAPWPFFFPLPALPLGPGCSPFPPPLMPAGEAETPQPVAMATPALHGQAWGCETAGGVQPAPVPVPVPTPPGPGSIQHLHLSPCSRLGPALGKASLGCPWGLGGAPRPRSAQSRGAPRPGVPCTALLGAPQGRR